MSVQTNTYVVWGVRLDYPEDHESVDLEEYQDSAYSADTNPKDGITVIADGMSGKYVVVGHVAGKTVDEDGEGLVMISLSGEPEGADSIREAIAGICARIGVEPREPGWIAFTHYR
jgi:DNA repair exonuclease SbcCD nuclease subunit